MRTSKKIRVLIFIVIIIIVGFIIFSRYNINETNGVRDSDYSSITYNGIEYELMNDDISISTMQYERLWKDNITKINTYKNSDVYAIYEIVSHDLIYLANPEMTSTSPIGLYKKSNIEIDLKTDTDIGWFTIYHYNEKDQSEKLQDFQTKDKDTINNIIKLLNNPKEKGTNNIIASNSKYYNAYFASSKYPSLCYNFQYVETPDEKFYLTTSKNIYEIDNTISKLIKEYILNNVSGYVDKIEEDIIYIDSNEYGYIGVRSESEIKNKLTSEKMRLNEIEKGDYLSIREYSKDENIVRPKSDIEIYRNISGEELKNEIFKNLVQNEEVVMSPGIKEVKYINESEEALVTFVVSSPYFEYFKDRKKEEYEFQFIINSETEIRSHRIKGYMELDKIKDDFMGTIELRKDTIKDKYPVVKFVNDSDN